MNFREAFQIGFLNKVAKPQIAIGTSEASLEVSIQATKESRVFHWSSVARVMAFKRDLLTQDLLCLGIAFDDGAVLELNEEMNGWASLLESLPDRLPGALATPDWFIRVTEHAFATTPVEIYRRDS